MDSDNDTLAGGFPHSEIRGSMGARPSPRLIAACHVLHRLSVPRHPPDALLRRLIALPRAGTKGPKTSAGKCADLCTCGFGRRSRLFPAHRRIPPTTDDEKPTSSPRSVYTHTLFTMSNISTGHGGPANSCLLTTRCVDLSSAWPSSGRRSSCVHSWWRRTGLNRRPPACKAGALPLSYAPGSDLVGQGGLEPPTSRLSSARSNQLSY